MMGLDPGLASWESAAWVLGAALATILVDREQLEDVASSE